jgi:dinuclear metal center YbgI/SA1388 family protein
LAVSTVNDILQHLQAAAPSELAAEWDNTGLLVGDGDAPVRRVMTCLTITPESAEEAVREQADLIVTHHPLPFRPLKSITTTSATGRMLLRLIEGRCAVISLHTAFDSAADGINEMLAVRLGLEKPRPLVAAPQAGDVVGAGRIAMADPSIPLGILLERAKAALGLATIRHVGATDHRATQIALVCGSGGSFLEAAVAAGCDTMVTGEATFHVCLAARAENVALVLPGHYASERFAMEVLGERIAAAFPEVEVWCSRDERDPISEC